MAIWKKVEKTNEYPDMEETVISCDCTGGIETCSHYYIVLLLDPDGDTVYIRSKSDLRLWDRVKYLFTGKMKDNSILIEKPTLESLIEELEKMKDAMV